MSIQTKRMTEHRIAAERRKVRRRIVCVAVAAVIIAVIIAILLNAVLVVKDITVIGANTYTADEIIANSGIKNGDSMFSVSSKDAERKLCDKLLYIKGIIVDRQLPSSLVITVNEEYTTFYTELEGEYILFNHRLRVIDRFDSVEGLLKVRSSAIRVDMVGIIKAVAGEEMKFEDEEIFSCNQKIVHSVSGCNFVAGIKSIDISDKYDIRINYSERISILFGSDTDFEIKMKNVESVMATELKAETEEKKASGSIDVSSVERVYSTVSVN